jgi:hypothetical protein
MSSDEPPTMRYTSASSSDSPSASASDNLSPLPSVSFINTATYACVAHAAGSVVFTLSVSEDSISISTSACTATADPINLDNVPEDFHEYADVFSKTHANQLAEHCPYDLKIDLKEGADLPVSRMYSLSERELLAL